MGNCNAREQRARPEQPACPVSDPAALHQPDETERQQRDAYGKGGPGHQNPAGVTQELRSRHHHKQRDQHDR